MAIEIKQVCTDYAEYLDGIARNMTQIYPLVTLMITSFNSITTGESHLEADISAWNTFFEALGIMFLWL
jgi:cellulase/cellobiase CelA1